MDRTIKVITMIALTGLLCALGAGAWYFMHEHGPDPLAADPRMGGLALPELNLVDQDGKAFTQQDMVGRVSIVNFGFSNCPLACPAMMAEMKKLNRELDGENVQFVSFSLDGVNDNVEALKHWAGTYNAESPRWRLVTGKDGVVRDILRNNLKMHVRINDENRVGVRSGGSMGNIEHPQSLLLIGPDGSMIGLYDSVSKEAMSELAERARAGGRRLAKMAR